MTHSGQCPIGMTRMRQVTRHCAGPGAGCPNALAVPTGAPGPTLTLPRTEPPDQWPERDKVDAETGAVRMAGRLELGQLVPRLAA